jgi:hypothetical protein
MFVQVAAIAGAVVRAHRRMRVHEALVVHRVVAA